MDTPAPRRQVQTKLALSSPGDEYEREADRVAEAVIGGRTAHAPGTGLSYGGVQRKLFRMVARPEDMVDSMPAHGAGGEPSSAEPAEEEMVQRAAAGTAAAPAMSAQTERAITDASGRGGRALAAPTRAFMESRIGWDFSSIRVHDDAHAHSLARSINARAFTLGNDIFFAGSEYQPDRSEGQRLLAHELVHTMQQGEGRVSRQIQRAVACSEYPGYDAGRSLTSYNCAGLATRTYDYIPTATATHARIAREFTRPYCPVGTCDPGEVKFWTWTYNLSFEDDTGAPVGTGSPDYHIVGARMPASGEPSDVLSKNGARRVYGPGTGPSWRPAARERALSNDPSETPLDAPNGGPLMKIRTNFSSTEGCGGCH